MIKNLSNPRVFKKTLVQPGIGPKLRVERERHVHALLHGNDSLRDS
jgi:hypothetical protein